MSIDDEYAAIGIDLRSLRRDSRLLSMGPLENPVELKLGRAMMRVRLYWGSSQSTLEDRAHILRALRVGEIVLLPRPPGVEPTPAELLLHGDQWARATAEADRRINRRRIA